MHTALPYQLRIYGAAAWIDSYFAPHRSDKHNNKIDISISITTIIPAEDPGNIFTTVNFEVPLLSFMASGVLIRTSSKLFFKLNHPKQTA